MEPMLTMDSSRYTFTSRVRYSEVDKERRLTLNSVVNYFQDCSTFQSEDIGMGLDFLDDKKEAWLLSSWQIVVNEYPLLGEEITVGTWAYDFNGFYGNRNFVMEDKNKEVLAYANSIWIFMDLENGRPKKISKDLLRGYGMEPKIEMDYAPRKISIPDGSQAMKSFPVKKYHIDTNNHVNNGQYIQMAKEYIPDDFPVRQMRAEYKKAAIYGDVVTPLVCKKQDSYVISLCEESGKLYAAVEFSK